MYTSLSADLMEKTSFSSNCPDQILSQPCLFIVLLLPMQTLTCRGVHLFCNATAAPAYLL
jgi:hypothetical protein